MKDCRYVRFLRPTLFINNRVIIFKSKCGKDTTYTQFRYLNCIELSCLNLINSKMGINMFEIELVGMQY